MTCLARPQARLANSEVLGSGVHTTRAEVIRLRHSFSGILKMGAGVFFLRFAAGGGPISLVANSCAWAGRSLRLAQRIVFGFIQALDFTAAEALIPDLQPCAERFWHA